MIVERLHRIMTAIHADSIVLAVVMGLIASCTDEVEPDKNGVAVELMGYVTPFETYKPHETYEASRAYGSYGAVTRAWTPPEGFSLYEDSELPIGVFFTQDHDVPVDGYEKESFYKRSGKWRVSKLDLKAETYYLYGYVPHEEFMNASVSVLEGKTFANGAVLTLENLNAVTSSDVCVIIGAKNGQSNYVPDGDYSVTGLRRGNFEYVATASGGASDGNYVYLLFDHLYAALRFSMRVQGDYAALRTIKVKDLSLQAFEGEASTKRKMDATIVVNATDGKNPIGSITFTPRGTEEASGSFFSSTSGEPLSTSWSTFQAHFMPQGVTKLKLTSTYDVYDTKGNLVRAGCKATNSLDISKLFYLQTDAKRGARYTISLTIQPTYLYVLSDPDLNNPTVVVED